jgi:CheY-like chemotaxis protein
VLAVDDNATSRRILVDMLAGWKMRVALASSGDAALEILARAAREGTPFQLVLADAQMPGMDGFALTRLIKNSSTLAPSKVVMLTWSSQSGDRAFCRQAGAATHLAKPVGRRALGRALCEVLYPAAQLASGAPLAAQCDQPGEGTALRPLRILLAEDNAINQRLASRLLENRGHTVAVASNGRRALDLLDEQAFDVVLMDVQMPEMDGFEATGAIRAKEKATGQRIPIVAMTAHAMKGDRERCLKAGMDGYISKPTKPEDLLAAIAALCEEPVPNHR